MSLEKMRELTSAEFWHMKEQLNELKDAIEHDRREVAERILANELVNAPDQFVRMVRKSGIFRTSRYGFRADMVKPLADQAIAIGGTSLSSSSQLYLKSVLALCDLAPSVAAQLKKAHQFINWGLFKTFLVTIDLLFRGQHVKAFEESLTSWRNYGVEELSDALSYYFALLQNKEAPNTINCHHLLTNRLDSAYYLEKLAVLAAVVRFREAEFQVEAFPYIATSSGLETTIEPISLQFEKSVRWGYISAEQQRTSDRMSWEGEEHALPSIKELAEMFVREAGHRMFKVQYGDQARIVIHLPEDGKFRSAFTGDGLFREDSAFVRDAMKSLFVTYEQVRDNPIHGSTTLIDLVKFRRFFMFLQATLDDFCEQNNLETSPQYYRSLVSQFAGDDALAMVTQFCGISKPKSLFELLCPTESKCNIFDLQYSPVVRIGDQYLFPAGVIANSNIIRNALQRSQFRFNSDASRDPLGDQLRAAFQKSNVPAKTRQALRYENKEMELDLLALVDNRLFAFECKNSLHPCNSFELRQSYDYILKATEQLDTFSKLFTADAQFRLRVAHLSGLTFSENTALTTCIVTGNRMFNGHRESGHPVRNVYELENFILGGSMIFQAPKDMSRPEVQKIEIRLKSWSGDKLTAADLVNYMENDSWHAHAFDAMHEYHERISFGKRTLRFKSVMLDMEHCRDFMRNHPQAEEEDIETHSEA